MTSSLHNSKVSPRIASRIEDQKSGRISKERVDPFSVLDDNTKSDQDSPNKEDINQYGMMHEDDTCSIEEPAEIQPGCMPNCSCNKGRREERTVTFDQFFEVMVKKIAEERVFSKDIIFESSNCASAKGRRVDRLVSILSVRKGQRQDCQLLSENSSIKAYIRKQRTVIFRFFSS